VGKVYGNGLNSATVTFLIDGLHRSVSRFMGMD